MNRIIALLLIGLAPCLAQDLKPFDRLNRENVQIDAKTVKGGSKIDRKWQTDYGSFIRDFEQSRVVEAKISMPKQGEEAATLEFFIILRDGGGKGEKFIKGTGEQSADNGDIWIFAASASRTHENYEALGIEDHHGEKIVGWFIRAVKDGQVVGYSTSSSALEKYAMSGDRF